MRVARHGFGSAGSSRSLRSTWTRGGLSSTAKERERRAVKAPPIALDEPSRAEILVAIATQQCCWCDDPRTFKALGQHILKMHGVDLAELRDRLGLPQRLPFAGQAVRQHARDRAIRLNQIEKVHAAPPARHHKTTRLVLAVARERADRLTIEQRREQVSSAHRAIMAKPVEERREIARHAASFVSREAHSRSGARGGAVRAAQLAANPAERMRLIDIREARRRARNPNDLCTLGHKRITDVGGNKRCPTCIARQRAGK